MKLHFDVIVLNQFKTVVFSSAKSNFQISTNRLNLTLAKLYEVSEAKYLLPYERFNDNFGIFNELEDNLLCLATAQLFIGNERTYIRLLQECSSIG
jgi:hypothetical protein